MNFFFLRLFNRNLQVHPQPHDSERNGTVSEQRRNRHHNSLKRGESKHLLEWITGTHMNLCG